MKLLSFITTIYNTEYVYLEELFNSFNSLIDDERIEFIIIDDESTNKNSFNKLLELYSNNSNFIFYKMNKNSKRSGAFAKGISLSNGKYLMSLDSDDLVNEKSLRLFLMTISSLEDKDFISVSWQQRDYVTKESYDWNNYNGKTNHKILDDWKKIHPAAVYSAYNSIALTSLAKSSLYNTNKVVAPHDDAYFSQVWISNSKLENTYYIDCPFFIYNVNQPWTTNSGSASIKNLKQHETLIREIIKLYNKENKLTIVNITSILLTHHKYLSKYKKWHLPIFWLKVKCWLPRKIRKQILYKKSTFAMKARSGIIPYQ